MSQDYDKQIRLAKSAQRWAVTALIFAGIGVLIGVGGIGYAIYQMIRFGELR